MKDYLAQIEKLRKDAAECALIRDLATDKAKREMFDRLCIHLTVLADQVEMAMLEGKGGTKKGCLNWCANAILLRNMNGLCPFPSTSRVTGHVLEMRRDRQS